MKDKQLSFRLLILLIILFVSAAVYFSGVLAPKTVKVEIKNKRIIKSNYNFIYEHWKEEKLAQLRNNEDFVNIKASGQLDLFLKLCDWVHRQWERSVPDPYPLSNAIDILKDIRSKKTGGFCGQYAYVLADVLKSMGYFNVRYVELWSNRGKNRSHFVVEAWIDRYEKWMILDADHNIYYEIISSGLPADAYEIRRALFAPDKQEQRVRARPAVPGQTVEEDEFMDLYANFAVSLRSDLMRHPKPLTIKDRFHMFLFFKDGNTKESLFEHGIPYAHITERIEDLYYQCNFTRVEYAVDKAAKDVILSFFTEGTTPNFKGFSISNDLGKTWQPLPGNVYRVKKNNHPVRILATAVNMYGRPGCINDISIQFRP